MHFTIIIHVKSQSVCSWQWTCCVVTPSLDFKLGRHILIHGDWVVNALVSKGFTSNINTNSEIHLNRYSLRHKIDRCKTYHTTQHTHTHTKLQMTKMLTIKVNFEIYIADRKATTCIWGLGGLLLDRFTLFAKLSLPTFVPY